MGATSNTSSALLSSSPSSNRRHQRLRSTGIGGKSGHFGLGSVRRVCENNFKNNKHNVAIATQVLSPKALSQRDSISRRRFVRHFGSSADSEDEEKFIRSKKRKLLWERFCYYGISVAVIILIMTGVVLAVGYMQSEKQKVLSRSQKLVQDRKMRVMKSIEKTNEPTHTVSSNSTEPPSLPANSPQNNSSHEIEVEELQIFEPPPEILNEIMESRSRAEEQREKNIIVDEDDDESQSPHRLPSEVKVLPPDGFTFDGFSFEFPIVPPAASPPNNTASSTSNSFNISIDPIEQDDEELESSGVSTTIVNADNDDILLSMPHSDFNFTGNLLSDGRADIPTVAKLQTELFHDEEEFDNESSASNKSSGRNHPQIPIPTEHDNSYTPRPSSVVRYQNSKKTPIPAHKIYNNRINNSNQNKKIKPPENQTPDQKGFNEHFYTAISSPNKEPTTTSSNLLDISTKSPNQFQFDYKTVPASIADFKFDFTTPSPTAADYSVNLATSDNNANLKFNLPAASTNEYNIDYTHLLANQNQGATTAATLPQIQEDKFSKRSFASGYDQYGDATSSNSNVNPYAHLLTPFTGVIGSATATGAALGYNQPSYNFESANEHHIPSGTIPLDLAASYIQAGNPPKSGNNNYGGSNSYSSDPNFAFGSLIQNGNGGSNDPKSSSYNTITQGIHLLNLLSGNIPQHLTNPHDQFTSASNINVQQQQIAQPEFQIAALTGYGGSSNAFLSGLNNYGSDQEASYSHAQARSLPAYSTDLHSSKSFPTDNFNPGADQLASASSNSFSKNIITKLSELGNNGNLKYEIPLSPAVVEELAAQPKSLTFNIIPEGSRKGFEKSFVQSFPERNNEAEIKHQNNAEENSKKRAGVEIYHATSPLGTNNHKLDMDTAGSEMQTITDKIIRNNKKSFEFPIYTTRQPFGRKLILKTKKIKEEFNQKETQERGLKSGFYV